MDERACASGRGETVFSESVLGDGAMRTQPSASGVLMPVGDEEGGDEDDNGDGAVVSRLNVS